MPTGKFRMPPSPVSLKNSETERENCHSRARFLKTLGAVLIFKWNGWVNRENYAAVRWLFLRYWRPPTGTDLLRAAILVISNGGAHFHPGRSRSTFINCFLAGSTVGFRLHRKISFAQFPTLFRLLWLNADNEMSSKGCHRWKRPCR